MEPFKPSNLDRGARFRESIRYKPYLTTEHMDRYQGLLTAALEHAGETEITRHNFDKIIEHVRRDPGYGRLYSAGPELDNHLREHLGIAPPTAANDNEPIEHKKAA